MMDNNLDYLPSVRRFLDADSERESRALDATPDYPSVAWKRYMTKKLKFDDSLMRAAASTEAFRECAGIAGTWLRTRQPGECGVAYDVLAETRQRGLFGKGESIRVRARLTILKG